MVNMARFFHSTITLLESKYIWSLSGMLSAMLEVPTINSSLDQLWSKVDETATNFLDNYRFICGDFDVSIVRDCFKNLLKSLRRGYTQPGRSELCRRYV